ncbi:MAG: 2-oxoacid:acceptor oxidoreductase family protein, partial [bacterium]
MFQKNLTLKIAGPAGMGIKSGSQLFSKVFQQHGFFFHDYSEYPSLIRGGHNTYQATFSDQEVFASYKTVDIFFSLKPGHWQQHQSEFTKDTLIFSDEPNAAKPTVGILLQLPLDSMAKEIGHPLVANTICLGVTVYLLGLDISIPEGLIQSAFGSSSDINQKALHAGFSYGQKYFSQYQRIIKLPKKSTAKPGFYDGNEAYGWGFIKGGGNLYAAYPMTPATGTLHFLAAKQKEHNLTVLHPEDEISAANIVAGAAFAGSRAATGTSGGGFALMNEAISFC